MTTPTYPDVSVELLGRDGNVFAIIGSVSTALRRAVSRDAAEAFVAAATECDSYDAVLRLVLETVEVR